MIGGRLRALAAASMLALLAVGGVDAATSYSQSIYRAEAFSTQATDYYCTAASVQNILNLATETTRHRRSHQAELYAFGRAHNRYSYRSRGVDPQGVEAMLEAYLPGTKWVQVRRKKLQGILRVAARQMRATGLPAVLFVGGGKHVWTMNGYTATRDPASGRWFSITYIQFSGPFYPKQKARHGWFDLPPNSRRSVERVANAFYPYKEYLAFGDHRWTPWNGWYVAVVPSSVGDEEPPPPPTPTPIPTPTPTPDASAEPTTTPEPTTEPEATTQPEPTSEPTSEPTPGPIEESSG